jgi:hypothetical protein
MSFWNLSDGADATDTGSEFEIEGGNLDPIPDDSSVLAVLDEAKWAQDKEYNNYISLRWSVAKPVAFENRKIFQKLWVTDDDPKAKDPAKKRDKALRMLAAIDANAGGKLARIQGAPTDDQLALSLCNKAMVIKVKVWSMNGTDGQPMEGNWVAAVSPKTKALSVGDAPAKPAAKSAPANAPIDDDIPF